MPSVTKQDVLNIYKAEVDALPEKTRAIFLARFLWNRSFDRIAQELETTVDSVRVHLAKARRILKSKTLTNCLE